MMMKKKFVIILLFLLSVASCSLHKGNAIPSLDSLRIKYLTNDSIKFWELEFDNDYTGIYFTRSGICDDYYIDDNNKRISENHSDLVEKIPLSYRITRDSLKICFKNCSVEPCCFYQYKLLKLTKDSLIIQLKYVSQGIDTVYENSVVSNYYPSKDQHKRPLYVKEAYPDDKSRWPKVFGE